MQSREDEYLPEIRTADAPAHQALTRFALQNEISYHLSKRNEQNNEGDTLKDRLIHFYRRGESDNSTASHVHVCLRDPGGPKQVNIQ